MPVALTSQTVRSAPHACATEASPARCAIAAGRAAAICVAQGVELADVAGERRDLAPPCLEQGGEMRPGEARSARDQNARPPGHAASVAGRKRPGRRGHADRGRPSPGGIMRACGAGAQKPTLQVCGEPNGLDPVTIRHTVLGAVPMNDLARAAREQSPSCALRCNGCSSSGWYVHGPEHDAFERELAAFLGSRGVRRRRQRHGRARARACARSRRVATRSS